MDTIYLLRFGDEWHAVNQYYLLARALTLDDCAAKVSVDNRDEWMLVEVTASMRQYEKVGEHAPAELPF